MPLNMIGKLMGKGIIGTAAVGSAAVKGAGAAAGLGIVGAASPALAMKYAVSGATAGSRIGGLMGIFSGGAGGMVSGGMAGSAVMPGIGTAIGGALGAYAGAGGGGLLGRAVAAAGGSALSAAGRGIKAIPGAVKSGLNKMGDDFLEGLSSGLGMDDMFKNMKLTGDLGMGAMGGAPRAAAAGAAAGPSVAANTAIAGGGGGLLAGAHPVAIAAGMAAVGGVTSYATGGNFMQGAVMGGVGGYAGVRGVMAGAKYAGRNLEKGMARDAARTTRAFLVGSKSFGGRAQGITNQRAAMLAGAGLSGMMFGGNRRSHKRGFNSRRGNGF